MALLSEVLNVKTKDGEMPVFTYGHKDDQKRPAVIVIQEIFGVNRNTQAIAQEFRDEGFVTAAPDLFYRGGPVKQIPYTDFDSGRAQAGQLTEERIVNDLNAVVEYLQGRPDVQGDKIAITGYCFGGRVAFIAAAKVKGIKAAAVYYGGGIVRNPAAPGAPVPLDYAKGVKAPIIGLFGNLDQNPSPDDVTKLEQTLKQAGKTIEVHRYDGAGHGFMCDDRGSYNQAAAHDAWPKTVAFFKKHLGVGAVAAG